MTSPPPPPPPRIFQSDFHVLMTADEKISVGWYLCLAGYRGLLDCCWCKWQAVLLHTDRKHQAFGVVSKWTVYCIILWVLDHILDRRACDFKVLNADIRSILVFVHSVVWEWILSWWVVTFSMRSYASAFICIPCRDIPLSWKLYWGPEWILNVPPTTVYCIPIVYWVKWLLMKFHIQVLYNVNW